MIKIVPYNSQWPIIFNELKTIYNSILSKEILTIEHIGSTSIPNLDAKPVIDIDIIIADKSKLNSIINKLETIGYIFRGELGIEDRFAFSRTSENVPFTGENKTWMKHHLYVCIENSLSLKNHLLLRDYLLKNEDVVIAYSKLKQELAEKYTNDIDNYVKYKTPFIINILEKQGVDKKAIEQIKIANGYD